VRQQLRHPRHLGRRIALSPARDGSRSGLPTPI
jgi:hypothetical protein